MIITRYSQYWTAVSVYNTGRGDLSFLKNYLTMIPDHMCRDKLQQFILREEAKC